MVDDELLAEDDVLVTEPVDCVTEDEVTVAVWV